MHKLLYEKNIKQTYQKKTTINAVNKQMQLWVGQVLSKDPAACTR